MNLEVTARTGISAKGNRRLYPDLHIAPVVRPLQLYYRALSESPKPAIKTRVSILITVVQMRLVTARSCRYDHSFDRLRIALHQVQKLLPCDITKSHIQVLPFRWSLCGTGTLMLLEMSPRSVHLQLGLKDKRRASQRLFKNNVLSALLEITVVPLAYIHRL